MNIAVIQLNVHPMSRAATLQAALHAIDHAADADPSPDLIILPAFADVDRLRRREAEFIERLCGPTFAAMGQRARSWGVFIAYGQAECEGENHYATTALIDPDGDRLFAHRQTVFPSDGPFTPGEGFASAETILGRLVLMMGDEAIHEEAWTRAAASCPALIVATAFNNSPDANATETLRERAARHGTAFALADVVGGIGSVVMDADGLIVASARSEAELILKASISPRAAKAG